MTAPLPADATRAQVLAYLGTFKGTVLPAWVKENPTLKPFQGKSATQVYDALATANPTATPYQIGQNVQAIWIGGGLSQGILATAADAGLGTAATETGIAKASLLPTGLTAIGAFFSSLGQSGTWVRVAKVAIGGTLVIVGLAKMTGAGKVIEGVVKP